MKNKASTTAFTLISLIVCAPVYADISDTSCAVQVAVSTPPIGQEDNVAFNVTGDNGASRAITLKGLSAPQTIQNVPCSDSPTQLYNISATLYSTKTNLSFKETPWIGQCKLKVGGISLYGTNSIISVVFPNDFTCV